LDGEPVELFEKIDIVSCDRAYRGMASIS